MDAIFGADLLTNPKIAQAEQVNLNLPELSTIELPEFNSAPSFALKKTFNRCDDISNFVITQFRIDWQTNHR